MLRETVAAKEAKRRFDCGGNRLGCPFGAGRGLQCGLSGNRVSRVGDGAARPSKGNHLTGNGRRAAGKANPTSSRRITLPCRRYSASNEVERNQMKKEETKPRSHWRWVMRIFVATVALAAVLSFASGVALVDAGYPVAILVLALFILLGIVFDVIGVAVTAADMRPFHSMAAHREKGAREALFLLKNAEKVSSFCNDVVGDICGIVSGSTAAVIVVRLQSSLGTQSILPSIAVTALISGLTIGGKAVGKKIAMEQSTGVVFSVAKLLRVFHPVSK